MEQVRAVVVNPHIEGRLTVQQVPAASPLASEALVQVAAISLNLGEVRRSLTTDVGWRPGWDLDGRHSHEWRAMA
jgi:NADPH:quinone reductase